ncbi:hypothetical protein OFL75_34925 [Pseudomonas aeruginosa]|uniref:Uncharacterized protein n=2 Tax=Pseudomonas TaxID=286 RepID=A0AA34S0B3_PSEPU|nr:MULTISPECIES: hypothetical protein [Pseudomonadaceae]AVX92761.1 hypothetical protein PkP19E3_31950 [Pseudomonas koreensis]AJA16804.1 hypothetical protein RPPX_25940 [Pseudomonas putida S12]ANI18760.1 hypothetical protein A9C11_32390 [Pseudomonas citronellolis]EKB9387811.1 hypothetical protein [Pseudomonas aeruginosa]EKD1543962.1 hypothetical protein [Pseudomonas aeruginosa]
MPEIQELPPEEIPKQITARHVTRSLGQHLEAFLAANNLQGWKAEEEYVLRDDRLADQLLLLTQVTGLYLGQFKRYSTRLLKLARRNGAEIRLTEVQGMVARALGYNSYHVAYKCRSVDDFIDNLWPQGAAMSLVSLDGAVAGMRQQSAVIQRLIDRYRFNKERDRMVNAGAKPGGQADPKMAKKMQGERRRRHSLHRSDGIKLRD